jgi:hypothetical protein
MTDVDDPTPLRVSVVTRIEVLDPDSDEILAQSDPIAIRPGAEVAEVNAWLSAAGFEPAMFRTESPRFRWTRRKRPGKN